MNKEQQLKAITDYIYELFKDDVTGHDFYHMRRVARTAKEIAQSEHANVFICEIAAWVHDVGDHKLFKDPKKELEELYEVFQSIDLEPSAIKLIDHAIKDVSFSKGNQIPETLEGKIVQDADRLDALGAVGIARTFAYGGFKGQVMYSESESKNSSVQHFYDKLFTLKYTMNTNTAIKMAQERHDFMENFIDTFLDEW
ncbi:HD domain-containing protein [Virgibacillus byunsanensis]|uniref:HD domain-containing protein n=1 Tax=Virgibacillus byunsanensis TaxID=570945 RepID=A0ABW3LLD3_9BACI